MSVGTYLTSLASSLVLGDGDKPRIETSISTIGSRISSHFGSDIRDHFKFGSSTRGTILPRKADVNSDIDYMVVFNTADGIYKPQTYLDRLRRFVDKCYVTSDIKQSHPTIVLELQHIKFELVPAIISSSQYWIPSPASEWTDWLCTDPLGFDQVLTSANTTNGSQIKPLIRLVKYWNARSGHIFASFLLESHVVAQSFWGCSTLKDYFYDYWPSLGISNNAPQTSKDKLARVKDRVAQIRRLDAQGKSTEAEDAIERLLPSI